jgi:hypothetical protein
VRHLLRVEHPLIDLSVLRLQTFRVSQLGGSIFCIAIGSSPLLLPLMFQLAFGFSAVVSGFVMLALFAGNLGIKPATPWVIRMLGLRNTLLISGVRVSGRRAQEARP